MTLIIIAVAIFVLYLGLTIYKFGIPSSVSETFYLLEKSKKGSGIIFSIFCLSIVGLLMPVWLNSSPEKYQFLAFLACGGLSFVGVASQFKEDSVKRVHFSAAGISAISAISWTVLMGYPFITLGIGIIVLSTACLGGLKFVKSTLLFWLEIISFVSLFITLSLHLLSVGYN